MLDARPRAGYVVRMYPQFSETFIVNEILELERRTQPIHIYSYRKPDGGRFHANLARVRAGVTYVPESLLAGRGGFARAHRALLAGQPRRYRQALSFVLAHLPHGGAYLLRCFILAGWLAHDVLRRGDIGHLHAHFAHGATSVAMLASQLAGVPYSFTAHARDIYAAFVDRQLLREKIARARFVVTVSDYNAAHLRRVCPEHAQKVRRLYNGVDTETFSPGSGVPAPTPLVLGVGRLVEKKGFAYLIDACGLLKARGVSFQCAIAGDGELHAALQAQIERLNVSECVRLAGPLPQEELVAWYRRASVCALPCVIGRDGNRDALPTVLLEAMACGVPAVSTDVTGVPEIIDHGLNGFVVRQRDTAGLAEALERVLRGPQLRADFSRAARAKAERVFDLRRNAAQLHEWLEGAGRLAAPAAAEARGGAARYEHRLSLD